MFWKTILLVVCRSVFGELGEEVIFFGSFFGRNGLWFWYMIKVF